jgi:hypothetical protein
MAGSIWSSSRVVESSSESLGHKVVSKMQLIWSKSSFDHIIETIFLFAGVETSERQSVKKNKAKKMPSPKAE